MTFESDANANRSGGNLRGAVREAVGIFASRDDLQKAIDELSLAGFQRHELSVLANDQTIRDHLGHVPEAGEAFEWGGVRVEVVDMDGRRIDKVLVVPRQNHSVAADE